MITHIEIEGFKSLKKVSLDLGGLNVLIGTNASGKREYVVDQFDRIGRERLCRGVAKV